MKLKFQTVAEKTAKNFRGLVYFASPGTSVAVSASRRGGLRSSTRSSDLVIPSLVLSRVHRSDSQIRVVYSMARSYDAADGQPTAAVLSVSLVQSAGTLYQTI